MPERVTPQRVFLSWSSPALPAAARWLLEQTDVPTPGDLSGELVVVPGGRAKRRLVEVLAELSAERGDALVPPTVVTVGALADRLMPPLERGGGGDRFQVADRHTSLLVRASVLRDAGAAGVALLTPRPPGRDDWPGWWSLALQQEALSDELGTVGLTPARAVAEVEAVSGDPLWSAVGAIDAAYQAALAAHGLVDAHAARIAALSASDAEFSDSGSAFRRVFLLASPDLRPIHTRLLERFAPRVTALVFAPEAHAAGYDDWGVLRPGYWLSQALPVEDDAVVMVGRPADQASAVLGALARWSEPEPVDPDGVSVGLGDAALDGEVRRTLELSGVPARSAAGPPVARSRPVLLLDALGAYATERRFDRLAALLRHPDVSGYVARSAGAEGLSPGDGGWLGLLDRYATHHLHGEVTGTWLGDDEQRTMLSAVYDAVQALLPDAPSAERRPITGWLDAVGAALEQVYGDTALRRHAPGDRPVVLGLEAVGNILDALRVLPADAGFIPATTFAQAVGYVVGRVDRAPVPEPGGSAAVELVGLLELALDDAAKVVVVGVNEGAVPEPIASHPLLPRQVRAALGLVDDDQRLARETQMLCAVVGSRAPGDCVLVTGRTGPDGDPLMPSRLLLQGSDALMADRVARFFAEDESPPPRPALLTPGGTDRFLIPPPLLDIPPITELSVTAFRDYLACPYRFYLKHVRKLRTLDDRAIELDGGRFGTLAHDALRALSDEALLHEGNPDKLFGVLSAVLDRRLRAVYGPLPRPAVRLQAEQLRFRLQAAAHEQARLVAEGWRVVHTEGAGRSDKLRHTVTVDGEPFTLTGKIDRIDQHADGGYRVLDYKTGDTAKPPEATHRAGPKDDKRWTDLQLPLYADLCAALSIPSAGVELAYFNVPKALSEVGVALAGWDTATLAEAREVRDEVIRAVRAQKFWPPSEDPPAFDDGLTGICADSADDRPGLVKRSGVLRERRAQAGGGDA